MNAKRKGSRRERQSRDLLRAEGYRVTKAGGSFGEFDLVAISSTNVLLVQVKSNRWPSSDELEAMRAFPAPANAKKLVHRWRDGRKQPDVKEV